MSIKWPYLLLQVEFRLTPNCNCFHSIASHFYFHQSNLKFKFLLTYQSIQRFIDHQDNCACTPLIRLQVKMDYQSSKSWSTKKWYLILNGPFCFLFFRCSFLVNRLSIFKVHVHINCFLMNYLMTCFLSFTLSWWDFIFK